jgi:predicted kinase
MLNVQDCRKYLDTETSESMSDSEVEAVRDEMYKLAGLILDIGKESWYGKRDANSKVLLTEGIL